LGVRLDEGKFELKTLLVKNGVVFAVIGFVEKDEGGGAELVSVVFVAWWTDYGFPEGFVTYFYVFVEGWVF
jgi:hypothetical protein